MKYTKLEINNYKGIKSIALDLTQDPGASIFTLVGLNESGKTTVLAAINFFEEDIEEQNRHTLIPRSENINFNGFVGVKASVELTSVDEDEIRKFARTEGFVLEVDIKNFSLHKKYVFEASEYKSLSNEWDIQLIGKKLRGTKTYALPPNDPLRLKILGFIKTKLMPKIIYYPNFLFDFPERIYLEQFEGEDDKQAFYRRIIQDILDSLGGGLSLSKHILDRIRGGSSSNMSSLTSTLTSMGSKITNTVFKPWDSLFKSSNKEIIVSYGKDDTDPEAVKYYLELQLKEGAEIYQIAERSLGFKWFFAFLLFTEFRKNRATDKGEILFLVDEPASNLHSTAQEKLTGILEQLVDKSKLIYTTHSHHLINPKWLENAFIVQNKAMDYSQELEFDSRRTDIDVIPYKQFVAAHPNQQNYFQPILDRLEYKPSQLELVPEITVVEGKNDYYTLRYVNEVMLDKPHKLSFYPGNGAGGNTQVIRLYLAWAKKFLVFLDSDSAGETQKQNYIDDIGKVVEDKIFTIGDVSKAWKGKATEDLFSEKEKMEIIKVLHPTLNQYSKEKFNSSIQHALFFKKKLKLSTTTLDRFEKIFQHLKDNLKQQ